jgi:hypothetical protein
MKYVLKLVNTKTQNYIGTMITHRQQLDLDHLQTNPQVMALISRLDLQVIPSTDYKNSLAVQHRVQELIQSFENTRNLPQVERSTHLRTPGSGLGEIFCLKPDTEAYLITIYGQRPWKTPLPHAPF